MKGELDPKQKRSPSDSHINSLDHENNQELAAFLGCSTTHRGLGYGKKDGCLRKCWRCWRCWGS